MGIRTVGLCAALLLGGLTACGGGSPGETSTVDNTQACVGLTWSATDVAALERVRFEGASARLAEQINDPDAPLYAEAREAGHPDAAFLPLPVFVSGDAQDIVLTMPAPLNPDDIYQDRRYQITLVAGDVRCDGPVLDVAGIRPGTGSEIDDYLVETKALLELKGSAYGYPTYAGLLALRADVLAGGELPPLGLLGVLLTVDALNEFEAALATLGAADRERLEAYMGHLRFDTAMTDYLDQLRSLPAAPLQNAATGAGIAAHAPANRAMRSSPGLHRSPRNLASACAAFSGDPVVINHATALDYYMREQKAVEDAVSGWSGALRQTAMAATPLIGLASGGLAAGVGLLLYIEYTLKEYSANTLPGRFDGMIFEVHPDVVIPEDFNLAETLPPDWRLAHVSAVSKGHNLTGAAIGALAQMVGAARYVGALGKTSSATAGYAKDIGQNELFRAIENRVPGASCLRVPPHRWDVDVSAPEWTQADLRHGSAFTLGTRTPIYQVLNMHELGGSELVLRTDPTKFGGRTEISNRFISAAGQQVAWNPPSLYVEQLGSEHDFTIKVDHTQRPSLVPTLDLPSGVTVVSGPTALGDGLFSVRLKTPSDEAHYPAIVTAARPGVLPPIEPRVGTLTLFSDRRIALSPASACVRPGETLSLNATLLGFPAGAAISWSASGPGQVAPQAGSDSTRTAIVTASGSEGEIVVQVWATQDAEVRDTARITVGSCDARMHVWGETWVSANTKHILSPSYDSEDEAPADLIHAPEPPQLPGNFWSGRSETFTSPLLSDEHELSSGLELSAQAKGELRLSSDADGGFSYRHTAFTLSDNCGYDPDSEEVTCAEAATAGNAAVNYYFDLESAGAYEVTVEGRCQSSGDSYASGKVILLMAQRFAGGRADQARPIMETFFPPALPVNQEVCDAASPDGYRYSRTFQLAGPEVPGQPDLIHFWGVLQSGLVNKHFGNHSPLPPPPGAQPTSGTYQGEAQVEISIRVRKR